MDINRINNGISWFKKEYEKLIARRDIINGSTLLSVERQFLFETIVFVSSCAYELKSADSHDECLEVNKKYQDLKKQYDSIAEQCVEMGFKIQEHMYNVLIRYCERMINILSE